MSDFQTHLTREEVNRMSVVIETDGVDMGFGRGFAPLGPIYSLKNVPKRVIDELKSFLASDES